LPPFQNVPQHRVAEGQSLRILEAPTAPLHPQQAPLFKSGQPKPQLAFGLPVEPQLAQHLAQGHPFAAAQPHHQKLIDGRTGPQRAIAILHPPELAFPSACFDPGGVLLPGAGPGLTLSTEG
jgi:hypothetical protein